jgi:hypothetical protein
MKITTIVLAGILSLAGSANAGPQTIREAFSHGMWLCNNVANAGDFAEKVNAAQNAGLNLTSEALNDIAKNVIENDGKDACLYFESDAFKPVAPNADHAHFPSNGCLLISDGKRSGWASVNQYIIYMSFHVVVRK